MMFQKDTICALTALVAGFGLLSPSPATAAVIDSRISGAKQCTQHIPRYEREYGIPSHLLSAISSTETGRWHSGLKIALPWPWTINAEGKSHYYDSKAEAVKAARTFRARGVKSFDVGCMQVNLYHHPDAFNSLEAAFEPQRNVAYAASFLRNLYQSEGTWKKAAAAYHSKTPALGNKYIARVFEKWQTIVKRLRIAKTVIAQADVPAPASERTKPMQTASNSASVLSADYQPPQMKVISLDEPRRKRENGIFIVRPDVAPSVAANAASKPFLIADANASETPAERKAEANSPNMKVINLSTTGRPLTNTKKTVSDTPSSGPRFIFSD